MTRPPSLLYRARSSKNVEVQAVRYNKSQLKGFIVGRMTKVPCLLAMLHACGIKRRSTALPDPTATELALDIA